MDVIESRVRSRAGSESGSRVGRMPYAATAVGATVLVGALIGLSLYARYDLRRVIASSVETTLAALADASDEGTSDFIASVEATYSDLATRPAVREAALALRPSADREVDAVRIEAATAEIRDLLQSAPWVESAALLDADGRVIVGTGRYAESSEPYPRERLVVMRRERAIDARLHFPVEEDGGLSPLFVSAPILDPARSSVEFYLVANVDSDPIDRLLAAARPGRTGEVYAFDAAGHMIGRSRFSSELGGYVLGTLMGNRNPYVALRDPGVDLTRGGHPQRPRNEQPLIPVVRWARARGSGAEIRVPHRDYRGVPVVSVWRWHEDRGYGLVAAFDEDEAFEAMIPLARLFQGVIAILAVLGLVALVALARARRAARRAAHFEAKTEALTQYEVIRKIGQGGMGTVFEVRHAFLQKRAALKLLPKANLSQELASRFEREARLTSALSHPNVVSVFDFGHTADGDVFYVMELIDGIDLDVLVRRAGPLPSGRVAYLLRQICGALAEAHAASLVHRDVKPANVLLIGRPGLADFVKIVDFGLVKSLDAGGEGLTQAHGFLGTPEFCAPEVYEGATDVDALADIYSVGALGYWLVTGTNVFPAKGVAAQAIAHTMTRPEPPSRRLGAPVDPELEATILACLEKRPEDRPHSAREIAERLERVTATWTAADAERWWREVGTLVTRDLDQAARNSFATGATNLAPHEAQRIGHGDQPDRRAS